MKGRRDDKIASIVGARLRAVRCRLGISQERWAESAGLTRAAMSSFENGTTTPSVTTLYQLAEAAGIHPRKLLP